jgi:hypothetical protein
MYGILIFGACFTALVFGAALYLFREAMRELREFCHVAGAQVNALTNEVSKARAAFAPTHAVPCKACSGTGRRVQENALTSAIAKAINAGLD